LFSEVKEMRGREKGFTLVEILFAIFVGLILMSAAYVAMTSGQQSSAGVERKVAAQQDVRAAMQIMGLELSMASYNPFYMPNLWHNLPPVGSATKTSCTGSGDQTLKGIREATPTAITVEMDIGENGQAGDDHGEIVRYEYLPGVNAQYITRETVNCDSLRAPGGAPPFLGSSVSLGPARTVRVINNNLENPAQNIVNGAGEVAVFRYYNGIGQGNELAINCLMGNEPSCAQIPNIRRIDITLAVETAEVDPSTKRAKQMIYSTKVLVRNHVF
jgi:prepilin-type N-terminal cleavage/methylation domain-containing protein